MNSIMVEKWPVADEKKIDEKAEMEMESLVGLIRGTRNVRAAFNIQHSQQIKLILSGSIGSEKESYLKALVKVSDIEVSEKYPKHTALASVSSLILGVPLEGLIDLEKESSRLTKERDKLEQEIKKVNERLQSESFLKNATEGSIANEKTKLAGYQDRVKTLEGYIKALSR